MKDLQNIYYQLKNNEDLQETIVNTFYEWKYEKNLDDEQKIDIFESWLATKVKYDNLTYSLTKSLYYLLKYTILITHEFMN